MPHSKGRVLLGVTGCIAAYKSCEILRLLQKDGYDVRVVMTESAKRFVGEVTFDALSGHQTLSAMFGDPAHPIPHIELAEWCDAFLIVPCTADVLAKVASGVADDLLTSTALAAWSKLAVAPAMNVHMYEAPATQANLKTLAERGVFVIEPASGRLACGDVGKGKLAAPEDIVGDFVRFHDGLRRSHEFECSGFGEEDAAGSCATTGPLEGKRVLITAGPTYERIDDVRYVANRSSGKMGYALAAAARDLGADVDLISGPVALEAPSGVNVVRVESALEMLDACKAKFPGASLTICSAAVADFRPSEPYAGKLKKSNAADIRALHQLDMTENPDILAELCSMKGEGQVVIGFAAEASDLIANAKAKLSRKGADAIVANNVAGGRVFGEDSNSASLVMPDTVVDFPTMSKKDLAFQLIGKICDKML